MLRIAVLLSGTGRSLDNLLKEIATGRLKAEIAVVIGSKADAYGLFRARTHGLEAVAVPRREYHDLKAFNAAINAVLLRIGVDLVVLAGFLSLYQPPPELAGRVMNIHPALLPAFGGKGFYGDRVHQAVLESGVKVSGCTVHFADERYDSGPIILQSVVPVLDDDTAQSLAARVFAAECQAYPRAIQLYADDRLRIEGRKVRILPCKEKC